MQVKCENLCAIGTAKTDGHNLRGPTMAGGQDFVGAALTDGHQHGGTAVTMADDRNFCPWTHLTLMMIQLTGASA